MDNVCANREAIIITRCGAGSTVMMSQEDYQALEETAYLLRRHNNAKRLLRSIARLEAGLRQARQLIE